MTATRTNRLRRQAATARGRLLVEVIRIKYHRIDDKSWRVATNMTMYACRPSSSVRSSSNP